MKKIIITAALTGTAIFRSMTPYVPQTPAEIAEDAVKAVKAGAAVLHIHVRDKDGLGTMETEQFEKTYTAVKTALDKENLDAIINLTTSGTYGGTAPLEQRIGHLKKIKPEMCSFDAGSMNWGCELVFDNNPDFLMKLSETVTALDVKPEFEIFDGGQISNAKYYMEHGFVKSPGHFQFVLGILGGLEGNVRNLQFLVDRLPKDATWSVTGIGKAHVPMMLAGLALGCDGLRVGVEDNLYYAHGIKATNEQLVHRAAELCRIAGREPATAAEAREILHIDRKSGESKAKGE